MIGETIVITGNGKGKTTAALGLIIQAAGRGLRVYLGQFMKDGNYSEIKGLRSNFPGVAVEQYSGDLILGRLAENSDKATAAAGLRKAQAALNEGNYDLIVLDEINVAAFMELIPVEAVTDLIHNRPKNATLVLTGRYAAPEAIAQADKTYEIGEIKHYYNQGTPARVGIEM
ncbi:MAG: cob(I)yrinic acid a,c-diamide adenosyltransferase [Clostridiales bacterium]|jgi:cob(I)alamin adenosyltransferase|nr:cob(I)yrinic acid a,c-diamide adenosyltransferase [Clostridiales bacterium]